jgi:hypothetical protein
MEISMETLMCLVLGEIKGARNEIRTQDERIARLEQWQERLKMDPNLRRILWLT